MQAKWQDFVFKHLYPKARETHRLLRWLNPIYVYVWERTPKMYERILTTDYLVPAYKQARGYKGESPSFELPSHEEWYSREVSESVKDLPVLDETDWLAKAHAKMRERKEASGN